MWGISRRAARHLASEEKLFDFTSVAGGILMVLLWLAISGSALCHSKYQQLCILNAYFLPYKDSPQKHYSLCRKFQRPYVK
jgi:hypothetical protein